MRKITLEIKWDKKENDFVVRYPRKGDGGYVLWQVIQNRTIAKNAKLDLNLWDSEKKMYTDQGYHFIEHDFIKELQNRGYDTTTLVFKIKIAVNRIKSDFPHIYEDLTKEEKKKLGI